MGLLEGKKKSDNQQAILTKRDLVGGIDADQNGDNWLLQNRLKIERIRERVQHDALS